MNYRLKVLIAVLIVVLSVVAALLCGFAKLSVVFAIAGTAFVVNRHICRCRNCSSWRTHWDFQYVGDNWNPGHGTTQEFRCCAACHQTTLLDTHSSCAENPLNVPDDLNSNY